MNVLFVRASDGAVLQAMTGPSEQLQERLSKIGPTAGVEQVEVDDATYERVRGVLHRTKRVAGNFVVSPADYAELRFAEYPHFTRQLEALWDDIEAGKLNKSGAFYKLIKDVKDKYPKP